MPDEIRRMRDDECLLLMRSEDPVIDKKYNLLHHPNVKYTPDAGGEPYVMPPDYMGDAVTITMGAVAAATAPEITEEMYEQLDYLEKHPEENYYENEENFSSIRPRWRMTAKSSAFILWRRRWLPLLLLWPCLRLQMIR